MSYAESPTETFIKFAQTPAWRNATEDVLAADFLSMSNESNLFLNPSVYEEKNGRLWDPVRRRNVAGSAINADPIEENVISQLESWFLSHESGIGVYISPRRRQTAKHPGYPEEQVTIYRIAYKSNLEKVLLYTSHQFKAEFRIFRFRAA